MPSSTSSSNSRIPKGNWWHIWILAILLATANVTCWETYFRIQGFEPEGILDSPDIWVRERIRASKFGDKAVILVGASRIQLGIDTTELRNVTGRPVIQLAIDGSPFMPVLANLAVDRNIRGLIIVSAEANTINVDFNRKKVNTRIERYNREITGSEQHTISHRIEDSLSRLFMGFQFAAPKPQHIFRSMIHGRKILPKYIITLPDRSRRADYQKVNINEAYQYRLERHKGAGNVELIHRTNFRESIDKLEGMVRKIQARGGRVVFVRFPTGRGIWEIDQIRYPREKYWDKFASATTAMTIHFSDYPSLSTYKLPDGSHLDYRDTTVFTKALAELIIQSSKESETKNIK